MAKRFRRAKPGDIYRVPYDETYSLQAVITEQGSIHFFGPPFEHEAAPPPIEPANRLFATNVMGYAVTRGRWPKLRVAPELLAWLHEPIYYIQDPLDPEHFELYKSGERVRSSRQECVGLERAAVWEPEQIEERIRDQLAGRLNVSHMVDLRDGLHIPPTPRCPWRTSEG